MILLKVILDNFRSHSHFEFEPALTGTTAISGENGAGKSTILDAFAWSLYGIRLHGLRNKHYIKEGVDPNIDTVKVQSFIVIGNREYKVERQIVNKEGGAICNIYSRELNSGDDYVLDCGPGISHSEQYIRNLIGADEKGFLSSVFIQQKQVDQIVSAGPRERGQVIEKLIGVSSIANAASLASEESRGLQKAAQIIQPGSIEEEKEKLQKQKDIVSELLVRLSEDSTVLSNKRIELENIEEIYKEESLKQESYRKISNEIVYIKDLIKTLKNSLTSQLNLYETIGGNQKFSEELFNEVLNDLSKERETLVSHQLEIHKLQEKIKSLDTLYSHKIKKDIYKIYEDKVLEKENSDNLIQKLKVSISMKKETVKHNKNFLKELKKGIASCPMCNNPITNLEEEKDSHSKQLEEDLELIERYSSELNFETEKSNNLLQEIIELQSLVDIRKKQEEKKQDYLNLKKEVSKVETLIKSTQLNISILEKDVTEMSSNKKNAETYLAIKETVRNLNNEIKEKENELKNKEYVANSIGAISAKDYKALDEKYNFLVREINNLNLSVLRLENQVEVEKERGRNLQFSYKKCLEAQEEYKKISDQINILNMSAKSLMEFKALRIKTSIPMLTSIASEILSKFTGGDFTEVVLTEKFEASVITREGLKRPVAKLSGGELSSVALALRLAIALFLHEGNQSLLILDEVLVSMSEERSQLILETITSLTQAQIIIIAHSVAVNSFADKVIAI